MLDDPHTGPGHSDRQIVSRRDVRPSAAETRAEIRRFRVKQWGSAFDAVTRSLVVIAGLAVLVTLFDHVVHGLLAHEDPREAPRRVVVVLLSLAAIVVFLRTDPPGGTGGLVGERLQRGWARRRPGRLHLAVGAALFLYMLSTRLW